MLGYFKSAKRGWTLGVSTDASLVSKSMAVGEARRIVSVGVESRRDRERESGVVRSVSRVEKRPRQLRQPTIYPNQ